MARQVNLPAPVSLEELRAIRREALERSEQKRREAEAVISVPQTTPKEDSSDDADGSTRSIRELLLNPEE